MFALPSPDFAVRLLVLAAAAQAHLCMPWNAFWDGPTWQKNLHPKSMWPGLFVEVTFYLGVHLFRSVVFIANEFGTTLHGFEP